MADISYGGSQVEIIDSEGRVIARGQAVAPECDRQGYITESDHTEVYESALAKAIEDDQKIKDSIQRFANVLKARKDRKQQNKYAVRQSNKKFR